MSRPQMSTGSVTGNRIEDQKQVQIVLAGAALRRDDLDHDEQKDALKMVLDAIDLTRRLG